MSNEINQQFEMLIQQEKELMSNFRKASIRFKISESEFWIYYALFTFKGDVTQQNISDKLSLPKQTINSGVTSLRKKYLVYLEKIAGTRNEKRIQLTEKGKEFGSNTVLKVVAAEQRAREKMTQEEIDEYRYLLNKYNINLRIEIDDLFKNMNE